MEIVLVFLVLMVLAFLCARLVRQTPSEYDLAVRRITAAFNDAEAAIGEALLPALRGAVAAFRDFADAYADAIEKEYL